MSQSTLKPLWPLWLGVALPLAALVALGSLVAAYPTLPAWDAAFLLRLHRYASPTFNRSVGVISNMGTFWGVLPASIALIALAIWHRRWPVARYLTLVMAGSAGLNMVAKQIWHRVRPALWEGIPPHVDFSFPSGHATYSMTFVLALVLINWDRPRCRPWLVGMGGLFALVIGFSRVYLGVHFPSDIVGGWLLAIAWAIGLHQLLFHWGPWLRSQVSI